MKSVKSALNVSSLDFYNKSQLTKYQSSKRGYRSHQSYRQEWQVLLAHVVIIVDICLGHLNKVVMPILIQAFIIYQIRYKPLNHFLKWGFLVCELHVVGFHVFDVLAPEWRSWLSGAFPQHFWRKSCITPVLLRWQWTIGRWHNIGRALAKIPAFSVRCDANDSRAERIF